MKNYLKFLIVFLVGVIIGGVCVYLMFLSKENNYELEPLPAQEKSEGLRGVYDIDNYLGI